MSSRQLTSWSIVLIVLGIAASGCTTPVQQPDTGSLQVTSEPGGAGVYLDNEYRGTTPAAITAVPSGSHTIAIRLAGYEPWSVPVTVTKGSSGTVAARLAEIPAIPTATVTTTATPEAKKSLAEIHVDGYWTYPGGRTGTTNPVPLIVHTEAFNVGSGDAREVTVAANFYYHSRMICWSTLYLGTLAAGSHVAKDSMVSCPLPSGLEDTDLAVRFENIAVTP
nr:PEGA domain-containing protein [uncultured Methanoregula sp.]